MRYKSLADSRTIKPWMKYAGVAILAVLSLGVAAYALLR